jgi:putative acetyltransferase
MPLKIMPADLASPSLRLFLQAHLDDIAPTAPAESQHAVAVDDMKTVRDFRLWAAFDDAHLVGTIGLSPVTPGHEELKSMRTAPSHRGRGIGRALLEYALTDAKARGVHRVSLETGSMHFFAPARAVYRRAGFVECQAFGAYPTDDPNSTFMTVVLGDE